MRLLFAAVILFVCMNVKAQTFYPGLQSGIYTNSIYNSPHFYDSASPKKWFISRNAGLTMGYSFFKGGNAMFTSAPLNVQLNRRLNDNWYAFAGVTVAPTYINFNRAFVNTDINKANNKTGMFKTGNFSTYSNAALGLMYVNDAKTFSISGSIGVERSDYPVYYFSPVNNNRPANNAPAFR